MRLAYLYSRYPVLSQTFCDAEMLELERRGIGLVVASMYPPKTPIRHGYLERLRAPIHYAPEKPALEELVRKAKRKGRWPETLIADHDRRYGPEYKAALRARNALFFVGLFERESVTHCHVHFANRAAHTAIFMKAISGITFSITAHGQDFMSDLGSLELLREICHAADFVAAETDFSRDLLAAQCPAAAKKIFRVFNGIELEKFPAPRTTRTPGAIRILSVGRLVEFKGFDVLIDACARITGEDFTCEIIGDGPLRESLQAKANDRIHLSGEQSQDYVLRAFADCDIFVLAAKVDQDGASDVFPTVIAEAMTTGKPVVSTTVGGIPELVAANQTGLLVPPENPQALADAITLLLRDADRANDRAALATARARHLTCTLTRMNKKAILLAGGAGTRLYPLTKIVCKQLLPVYDKPMICYPLATLMLGGLREVLIISTPKDLPMLEDYLGDGSRLGIRIEYAAQPKPDGIAQAFLIGAKFIGDSGASLILGDNIFYGNLDFYRAALAVDEGACIFGYQVRDPERYGVVEFGPDGKAISLEEKPKNPKSHFAIPGLYVYDDRVVEFCRSLAPSARGELEITDLNRRYLEQNELHVKLLTRGMAWLDTGTQTSLLEASNYIATIEHRQGMKIACLEEVAFRSGFIDHRALTQLIDDLPKGEYREYLRIVAEESQQA